MSERAIARRDDPTTDVEVASAPVEAESGVPAGVRVRPERGSAPTRPPVASFNTAPVVARRTPPLTVRLSEFLWICSLLVGALTVVYYFVIRKDQTPLIVDAVKALQGDRPDAVYATTADIVFWTVFWVAAATLVIQIALLVSFMNRRPHARLWQLGTVVLQGVTFALAADIVALGEKGELLQQLFLAQVSLSVLALLFGAMSRSLKWTARRVDVRRAGDGAEM